jgi:hypothetical protein
MWLVDFGDMLLDAGSAKEKGSKLLRRGAKRSNPF